MTVRKVECPRIRLIETPSSWRFLSDDGQLVEVTGHNHNELRQAALAYFEANTEKPKPSKASQVWVRIEGTAVVRPYELREVRT